MPDIRVTTPRWALIDERGSEPVRREFLEEHIRSWQVWSQQRGDAASYDAITADDQQVPSHW